MEVEVREEVQASQHPGRSGALGWGQSDGSRWSLFWSTTISEGQWGSGKEEGPTSRWGEGTWDTSGAAQENYRIWGGEDMEWD